MADLKKSRSSEQEGVIRHWVTQGSMVAESAVATTFDILRDVQGELAQRFQRRIEWAEKSGQSRIQLARGVNERLTVFTSRALDAAQSVALKVVRAARDTGYGVTDREPSGRGVGEDVSRAA